MGPISDPDPAPKLWLESVARVPPEPFAWQRHQLEEEAEFELMMFVVVDFGIAPG